MARALDLLLRLVSPYAGSRRRRQRALAFSGALLAAMGLLLFALLLPEMPFAGARVTSIDAARPGDLVKVYGRIECSCSVAIDYSEEQVGLGLSKAHWTAVPFSVRDPGGLLFVDTDSVATVKPGAHGGDYWAQDFAAVFGTVYDQGGGVLAIRAQFIAPTPHDSPAVYAFWFALAAALGGLLMAAAVADQALFGARLP